MRMDAWQDSMGHTFCFIEHVPEHKIEPLKALIEEGFRLPVILGRYHVSSQDFVYVLVVVGAMEDIGELLERFTPLSSL